MSRVASQPTSGHHAFLACVAACQDCQPEFLEAAMNLARRAATRGRNTGRRYEEAAHYLEGGRHLLLSTLSPMRDSQITAAAGARYA